MQRTENKDADKKKSRHLTEADRRVIEELLKLGHSIRMIANVLHMSPSSISREIKRYGIMKIPRTCDCVYFRECTITDLCDTGGRCKKLCRTCPI